MASRVAGGLYVYVALLCGFMSLALPWTDLDRGEAIALARVLLFLAGSVVGRLGVTRRNRRLQLAAAAVGFVALIELVSRIPLLLSQYDVAVANAGWFAFLGANSVFVALIAAGYLSLTGDRELEAAEPSGAV
jgi:hypothetical protein